MDGVLRAARHEPCIAVRRVVVARASVDVEVEFLHGWMSSGHASVAYYMSRVLLVYRVGDPQNS